jgi:predicted ribosomally synthesized peptide with SipW-like signal peptide
MNKKRLMLVACLVLAVALVAAGTTMSYLTSTPQSAVNQFGVGTLTPDIKENGSSTPSSSNSIGERSAGVFPKLVQVENKKVTNAIDAYVRVQLVPMLRDGTSNLGGNFAMTAPSKNTVNGMPYGQSILFTPFGDATKLQILLVLDDNWHSSSTGKNGYWNYRADDNCFYYTGVLAPGDITQQPLLTEVHFYGIDAASWEAKFNVDVLTDSIQADGTIPIGGTPKAAAADAWHVTINNKILTPSP